jgi:K+-sensing histidine kinase KdpD
MAAVTSAPSIARSTSPLRLNLLEVQGVWDHDAMRRVVMGLVSGARRYATEGTEVSVDLKPLRESALLSVRGEGRVRDDEIDVLFEPWKRASTASEPRRTGAGLGLFVARELVQAHGGRLTCERVGTYGFALRATVPTAPVLLPQGGAGASITSGSTTPPSPGPARGPRRP